MVNKERSASAGLFTARSFFTQRASPRTEQRVLLAALGIYLIICIALLLRHEVSHDEAQAWLIARDAPDLSALFAQMRYEGSGALWHLLLRPFARSGWPFQSIYALNLLCCAGTVTLILLRAPLPLWVRVLLPFTYLFLFEYAVFARSYALGAFLFFLATTVWRSQPGRVWLWTLLLLLCANCNLNSMILAGGFALTILLTPKAKGTLPGLGLLAVGFFATALYVWPPSDSAVSLQFNFRPDHFTRMLSGLRSFGFVFYLAFGGVLLACTRNRNVAIGFVATQLALLLFFSVVPLCDTRHYLFLFLSMLWLLWLGNIQWRPILSLFLLVVLLSMVARAAYRGWAELRVRHRYPQEFAETLKAAPGRHFVAADPPSASVTIAAFLPRDSFYFPLQQRWGTFVVWDKSLSGEVQLPAPSLSRLALQHPGYDVYYFITLSPLAADTLRSHRVVLIRESHEGSNAEAARDARDRYLYRFER
ncbi:MAG: hypothetical protein EOO08_00160 [Chitinophagaceae bacterium]|nr:MAG: hypothetical protein EOO08_00160 [Chitinophagaceae bacterium]